MGKQMTEMLKGTLEGIVLAILSMRPAYGYEITAGLRERGFSDIAEGTIYALQPVGTDIWIALAWCLGILVVAYVFAMATYRRRIS